MERGSHPHRALNQGAETEQTLCGAQQRTTNKIGREGAPRASLLHSSTSSTMHLAELEHISENITSGHGAGKPPALHGSTGSSWGAPTAQQITLGPSDVLSDLRPNAMHYNYKGISNNLFFSLLVLVRVPCSGLFITRSSVWDLYIRSSNALLAMLAQAATSYRLHQAARIREKNLINAMHIMADI